MDNITVSWPGFDILSVCIYGVVSFVLSNELPACRAHRGSKSTPFSCSRENFVLHFLIASLIHPFA